ncbi:MAG: DegV family protein [bacterium]
MHISSKMSGTLQSAQIAKKELDNDRIHIIDSGFTTVALGLMAIECSKAAENGKNASEITDIMDNLKKQMNIYFIVDTLEYLHKGGRIGRASAILGGLLNIKPILCIKMGEVCPYEKVRGSRKVYDKMSEIFYRFINESHSGNIETGFAHASSRELLACLTGKIENYFDISNCLVSEVGPVVGSHTGPGALAMCFYRKSW